MVSAHNVLILALLENTPVDANYPLALAEEPPTPMWELILEQFKDQLVLILLGSAAVSFVLALFEESDDWTAFVDPVVVRSLLNFNCLTNYTRMATNYSVC